MADGAGSSSKGRRGAPKRAYKQLNLLVQIAEGTQQPAAAPGSVYYVRSDSTAAASTGKLEECAAALLLPLALAAPDQVASCSVLVILASAQPPAGVPELQAGLRLPAGLTIAERQEGSGSDSSVDDKTLVARHTAATFTVKLPFGVQLPVTEGSVRRAQRCTPAQGAGLMTAITLGEEPGRVRLQLAGRLEPLSGTRRTFLFNPKLQLELAGAAAARSGKRRRSEGSDDEGSSAAGAGGGSVNTYGKKKSESIATPSDGPTTIELRFEGASADVDIQATLARLASSGAAVAAWLDAPPDALPRVLHFEALEGLQKQGGGAVGQAELARLRSQLADAGHMSQPGGGTAGAATAGMVAAWAPAAGAAAPAAAAGVQAPAAMQLPVAGAGGDQVAQLSTQLQVLSVHVATQAAQFGAVLQQHSCTLQQHAQVQQRHEADILAHGEGLRAQQAVNEQLAGAAAHVTSPAGQQQQQQQLRGLGGGGLPLGMEAADIEGLVEPGSPRSFQQLAVEMAEDAVPASPLPPPQPAAGAAGEGSLESQVRQALLWHGLSVHKGRTRSEVAAAVRTSLPTPLHLPTVMACVKLVPRLLDALCSTGEAWSHPSPAPPLDSSAQFWLAAPVTSQC